MAGTEGKVLRIVPAAALVALVVAGCGGAARTQGSAAPGVPPALAHDWARQASAIAAAAAAGNSCRALQLASSLRDQVIAAEGRVPDRLQRPLVSSVNALADRITCRQTVTVQAPPPTQPPPTKPKPPPDHHDHHGHHGHGGDNGNADGQG
jgi:hypothetical protein